MCQLPTEFEMRVLINKEMESMKGNIKEYAASIVTPLRKRVLEWEYGNNEEFPAWQFADFRKDSLCAVYCLGGHGANGSPWGFTYTTDDHFGLGCCWYDSFEAMLTDSLYE